MRALWIAGLVVLAGCSGGGDVDGGSGLDGSAGSDAGAADAGEIVDARVGADGGTETDAGVAIDAAVEADAGAATDAGTATDASTEADAGAAMDAGAATDAGSPGPTSCAADTECPASAICAAGLCYAQTTTTNASLGLGSIARLVAGADADGSLRLLTGVELRDSSGFISYQTYDVVGTPDALSATAGGVSSDLLGLEETGRAQTSIAHSAFASSDERWVLLDQTATVTEYYPIYSYGSVHAADGTEYVFTTPQVPHRPSELYDPYPLHLWTQSSGTWTSEELVRNTGIDRDLHLHLDASGAPIVFYTDTFWIKRWRLEAAGWTSTILYTFAPAPSRTGPSLWIEDDHDHTHLLHLLYADSGNVLAYVELDDTGMVRDASISAAGVSELQGSLAFDDAGDLFFLSIGGVTSPSRQPYVLHRISRATGVDSSTLLGSVRTDFNQRTALAVAPDGTITIFVYSPTQPLEIHTFSPR